MEWVVVLWFYKGMTSFEVESKEVCTQVVQTWKTLKRESWGFCVNQETGETFEVRY